MPDRDIEMRADREAAAEFLGLTAKRATGVLSATHNRELSRLTKAFACHRLAFAATSAVAADGEARARLQVLADTNSIVSAYDPFDNRIAAMISDVRNLLSALSASPLPGREEIARVIDPEAAAIAHHDRMCGTGPAA